MKKKRLSLLFVLFITGFICGQGVFAEEPGYVMNWEWFDEDFNVAKKDCEYVIGEMKNFSGKDIVKYEISFILLDKEMIPLEKVCYIADKAKWKNNSIEPFVFGFDRLEEENDVEIGYVDFIYLSSITFDDGTTYEDPGTIYFLKKTLPEYKEQLEMLRKNNFKSIFE